MSMRGRVWVTIIASLAVFWVTIIRLLFAVGR